MFYQFCFITEILITLLFWTTLWPLAIKEDRFLSNQWAMAGLVLDHSAPMFCLLLDYILVSTVPFTLRHSLAFIPLHFLYGGVNLQWQLTTGNPVYPTLDWTVGSSYLMLLLAILILVLFTFLLKKLTHIKMKYLNHNEINEVIKKQGQVRVITTAGIGVEIKQDGSEEHQ